MPADATETTGTAAPQAPTEGAPPAAPVAKDAPTEQQQSQPGAPKRFAPGQTVCNERNEKGKLCNGHLKQTRTGGQESGIHLRGDDVLHQCQTCGALYIGPPLGHVRDPEKQDRFVQKELTAILQAAGGTLPFFGKTQATATTATTEPTASTAAAPIDETPEQKKARLIAEAKARKAAATGAGEAKAPSRPTAAGAPPAAPTSGTDSSPSADAHRPAAEAQAATGQASAVPLSPAAATASPAAGVETPAELSVEASTELTPGAPKEATARTENSSSSGTQPVEKKPA